MRKMVHLRSLDGYVFKMATPTTLLIGNGHREYVIHNQMIDSNKMAILINRVSINQVPKLVKDFVFYGLGDGDAEENKNVANLLVCCINDDLNDLGENTLDIDEMTAELHENFDFVNQRFRTLVS